MVLVGIDPLIRICQEKKMGSIMGNLTVKYHRRGMIEFRK